MGKTTGQRGESYRQRAAEWHERKGLRKGLRHLVHISVLALLGHSRDLNDALDWALSRRVPLDQIQEAILQAYLFAGFPRALHAMEQLDAVLSERREEPEHQIDRIPPRVSVRAFLRRRGRLLFGEVYRSDADLVIDRIESFHPEFMDWILEDAYGKVLSRPFLDLKTREILAVSMLSVLDLPRQLTPHIRGALRAGANVREVSEAIGQLALVIPQAQVDRALVRVERASTSL